MTSRDSKTYPNSSSYFVRNPDGTGGFVSELACVTQAGWGYSSRVAVKSDKARHTRTLLQLAIEGAGGCPSADGGHCLLAAISERVQPGRVSCSCTLNVLPHHESNKLK